ncbi:MAG: manganese efflux pump [Candidatus Saccharibacteria bacterium]
MNKVFAITLLALSTGLDNFAVSIAIGIAGVKKSNKIRIALIIGLFETGMTIAGLLLGHRASQYLGDSTHIIGGGLLILTGAYTIFDGWKEGKNDNKKLGKQSKIAQQLITGLSLSIDNLIVGFGLGSQTVPLTEAILIIAAVSTSLALAGITIGSRISFKLEEYSELISGGILILVGLSIAFKLL